MKAMKLVVLSKYIFLVVLTGIVIGCGGSVSDRPSASTRKTSANFKVAMLIPSVIDDSNFSQAGYSALKAVEKELDAEIAYTEKIDYKNSEQIEQIIRKYAEEGFDFIVAHGSQHLTLRPAEIVAQEFPRTKFAVILGDNPGNNRNLGVLKFRVEELGYLAGIIAALKTKTERITFISGVPYDYLKSSSYWFEQGAKTIKPEINVRVKWVGNWTDTTKAIEIAREEIDLGSDVLLWGASLASLPVFSMAKEAGVYVIGWQEYSLDMAPEIVLTSVVFNYSQLLLYGANLVKEGRWEGKIYRGGLREGILELAPFSSLLTDREIKIIEAAKADILTKKIELEGEIRLPGVGSQID